MDTDICGICSCCMETWVQSQATTYSFISLVKMIVNMFNAKFHWQYHSQTVDIVETVLISQIQGFITSWLLPLCFSYFLGFQVELLLVARADSFATVLYFTNDITV